MRTPRPALQAGAGPSLVGLVLVVLALGLVGPVAAAEDAPLAGREVRTTGGQRQVCWEPPALPTGLDAPVDVELVVGGTPTWSALRCRRVAATEEPRIVVPEGVIEGVAGEVPVAAPGPLRWHGPALEPPRLPDGVQQVAIAADGALWFARCKQGVTRLHPERGERRTWTERDGLPPGCVTQVDTDADGHAWVITPDRAARVHPQRGPERIVVFDPEDRASVSALRVASDGTVWLGGQGGRLRGLPADPDGRELRFAGARLGALDTIGAISEAPDGSLWLSSRGRLTHLWPGDGRFDVRVSRGPEPGLPEGQPGTVAVASDGAWVVVRPETPGATRGALVRLTEGGFERLDVAGLPDLPLALVRTPDDALWVADGAGLVRVAPDRSEARRVAVRDGFVPGGPWAVPLPDSTVWASVIGELSGATLDRLSPTGAVLDRLAPETLPPPGVLVPTDDRVLLATSSGLWQLAATEARWVPHPGFGDGLRGWNARRLRAIHTGPTGLTWLAGEDGLRVGRARVGFQDATPPGADVVYAVREAEGGGATIATDAGLFDRDRLGRVLRVVDDGGRPVTGVEHLLVGPGGALWAWGSGGAWTLTGSDAVRRVGGPVQDLVRADGRLWVVRDDVRVWDGERFVRVELPRGIVRPRQIAVRDGEPLWVRDRSGIWRRDDTTWRRAIGVEGPFLRSDDGTLWRWDPDGLHVLPPTASTWRWVGLPARPERIGAEPSPSIAPIAADAISVHALSDALAVEVEGRILGDPLRADPIVDLDVRGTRWAALSRRGVLLRGDGYRLLERSYVPGPARRVALGPRQVCVAGTAAWCRTGGRWEAVLDLLDLPAPLPAVDLVVDEAGDAWSLHPGALCRQGRGCRPVPGVSQTALVLQGDTAFVADLQGVLSVPADAPPARLGRPGAVLDLALGEGSSLWLATEERGLIVLDRSTGEARVVGFGHDPRHPAPGALRQVAVTRTGHVWVRQGDGRLVRPGPTMRLDAWPWAVGR